VMTVVQSKFLRPLGREKAVADQMKVLICLTPALN